MELIDIIVKAAEDKKAIDISALKVDELTTVTDYFIIMHGNSSTRIMA